MNNINKIYDTSIGFMERYAVYFNVDKVNAKNKIGFIYNDYSVHPCNDKLEKNNVGGSNEQKKYINSY